MKTTNLEILEKTQLPKSQARAILEVMELEIMAREEVLVTKSEFREAMLASKNDLKDTVKDAVHRIELRIEGSEGRLTRWVFTCVLGLAAVMAGAMYFALAHQH